MNHNYRVVVFWDGEPLDPESKRVLDKFKACYNSLSTINPEKGRATEHISLDVPLTREEVDRNLPGFRVLDFYEVSDRRQIA